MKIITLALGAYPEGEATTNRVISILRGLAELNNDVDLFVLGPTRKKLKGLRLREGKVNNVSYRYLSKYTSYPGSKIKWLLDIFFSIIKAILLIKKINKIKKIDVLLILINEPFIIFPFLLLGKIIGLKIFHELNETPEITYSSSLQDRIIFYFYIQLIRRMNGIYVISSYLKKFFAKYISEDKICIVNMTVDPSRFEEKTSSPFDFEYIGYCGTMYGDKDGVFDLLEAYSIVKQQLKLKLVLIGDITDKRVGSLKEKIIQMDLVNDVILTGSIASKHVPAYLLNATILVLARPDSLQAKAGFPTKLGEYLLCEKPVLVTNVGDISKFLNDGESVFFSEPGIIAQFAEKLLFIRNNYEVSLEISRKGKNVALKHFNYKSEALKLFEFLKST